MECQQAYRGKLMERSGMADCKLCATLMEERLKPSKASTVVKVDTTCYRSIISRLRYLTHKQSDISYAAGYVSGFMEDPQEDLGLLHLMRYIKGTTDQGVIFPKTGGARLELKGFNNADMAGKVDGQNRGRAPPVCSSSLA